MAADRDRRIIEAWQQDGVLRPGRPCNVWQKKVRQFMEAMNQSIGDKAGFQGNDVVNLRIRLVREEADEFAQACYAGDFAKAIDALCDCLYVVAGGGEAFGVDLSPFFDLVHTANMAKAGGPTDAFGKVLKPPSWTPPDVAAMLEALYPGVDYAAGLGRRQ